MIFQKKLQGTFHWIPIGYHQQGQDATMWYIWWICLCEFRMAFWCYHGLSMDWMGNDSKIWGRWVSNHQSNGILWTIIRGLERTMMGIFHGIPKRSSLKSIHLMGMFTVEIFTSKSTQWICLWISRSLGSQGLNLHWRRNLRFFYGQMHMNQIKLPRLILKSRCLCAKCASFTHFLLDKCMFLRQIPL